jgi:hypothetical protein
VEGGGGEGGGIVLTRLNIMLLKNSSLHIFKPFWHYLKFPLTYYVKNYFCLIRQNFLMFCFNFSNLCNFTLNKLPILYQLQKRLNKNQDFLPLSLGDPHVSLDPGVNDDDENKIIYFVFCFFLFFLIKLRSSLPVKLAPLLQFAF